MNALVYCVRHGDTQLNAADCFRGNKDVLLNADGKRDADTLSKMFAPMDFGAIVSSDRRRAKETAERIANPHKQKIEYDMNLRAWNVGTFSGKPKNDENLRLLDFFVEHPDQVIPDGESLNAFKERIKKAFANLYEKAVSTGRPIMAVSHSSVVHEIGSMIYGHHKSVLVDPGGAVAIYMQGGRLAAKQIFKPRIEDIMSDIDIS